MSLHRRLTVILGLGQLLTWALTYYLPAVLMAPAAAGLGVSPTATMGAFSLALLCTGVASPFACRRIDRVGGRPVLLLGVGVQAAGLVVMAGAGGPVQWYAGWMITGGGMACGLYDAAFATAGRALGTEARATITAITLLGGFASSLGWPLGAMLEPVLGWRAMLLAYAAGLVLLVGPLYLLLPRGVTPKPAARAAAGGAVSRQRSTFLWVAGFFTLRGGIATVITVSIPTLLHGAGLGTATAVALAALIGPAQVGMRVLQVALGQRVGPLAIAWIGAAILPAVTLPMAFLGPDSPALPVVAGVFVLGYGLSNGILTIARGILPLALFGAESYATRIGQLALPVILAQAAAPLVSGPAISAWPAAWVFAALAAASLLAAAFLVPLGWRQDGRRSGHRSGPPAPS